MKNTDVTTGIARLSYVNVFAPRADNFGGDPKFSVTILVPKTDAATKQRIDAAINAAIAAGVAEKWAGQRPPILPTPVYDGDGTRPSDGMPFGPECKGHWVFTASNKMAPHVVDQNVQPILNQSEVYSGAYGRVSVSFFAYNSNGKKGIGCSLNGVQKMADGESLAGGVSAEEAFGGSNAAPSAPTQATAPAYQPAPQPTQPCQPTQPPAIDPITGLPVNGVMGL